MNHSTNWFLVALINFLIAAIYGAILRLAFVTEISWIDFRNLMHGHSHVAMLGWLYLALFILFLHFFIKNFHLKKYYKTLFIVTQISILGMAISFPIQGYGAFSIFFSTVHVLASYVFVFRFFKDSEVQSKHKSSLLFAKTSLLFMVLSTMALFTMAPIMIMDLKTSALYYLAVQFFLHFQFNGWFIFAILALFLKLLENWKIQIDLKDTKRFYWTLVISCILTYALAVTWSNPSPFLFLANSTGVLIQLTALYFFIKIIRKHWIDIKFKISRSLSLLMGISLLSFCIKIIVQSAVVIPFIAKIGYTIRNYVIGFIHLILLGAITFAIFSFASKAGIMTLGEKTMKKGIIILVLGIVFSEILLFLQGTMFWASIGFIPYYYELLFAVSILMPLGITVILISILYKKDLLSYKEF